MNSLRDVAVCCPQRAESHDGSVKLDSHGIDREQIEEWKKANDTIEMAKARKESIECDILDRIMLQYRSFCQKCGHRIRNVIVDVLKITFPPNSHFIDPDSLDEDKLRSSFGAEFEEYFEIVCGPIRIADEAFHNSSLETEMIEFFEHLSRKYPNTRILEYDSTVVPRDCLADEFAINPHSKLNAQFKAAGIRLSKPLFRQR